MTVLVKGMEMPESCKDCPLCAGIPLGSELVYHKCLPLDRLASKRSRRGECPLIEVPTPHGRLIDKDALSDGISKRIEHLQIMEKHDNEYGHAAAMHLGVNVSLVELNLAPTVIEAED